MKTRRKHCVPLLLALFLTACARADCDCDKTRPGSLAPSIVSAVDQKEMALVPAGEFLMGTDRVDPEETHKKIGVVKPLYMDQQPERKVHLGDYYIDKYEVTNKEYKRFLDETGLYSAPAHWENGAYPDGLENHPVTQITWLEALAYALWAHKRLPTEAQWEKAARGTDGRLYPWGNDYVRGMANMGIDEARRTEAVGSYPKDVSPYQVFDMAGNVMEWVADWYEAYPGSSYTSPRFGQIFKVIRGNGFQKAGHYFLDAYRYVFFRTESEPEEYFENVGFRCVMQAPGKNA